MNIEYLKEFMALADSLNYSKAAQELFISQPTLSRHIKLMEKELGFSLVKTSSHGVELTAEGEDAVRSFRKMLLEYDYFCERGRISRQQLSGRLKIGLLYYSVEDYFSDFIPEFKDRYPNITLEVFSYQPHQLYEDLLKGKIDVGQIVSIGREDESLKYQKIAETGVVAVMAQDHPLAKKDGVILDELKNETLIELTEDIFSADLTRRVLEKNKAVFRNTIQTGTIETVPYMIRKTGGIHITGESVRKQGGKNLAYVTVKDRKARVSIFLAALKSSRNELTDVFLNEAKEFYVLPANRHHASDRMVKI